MKMIYFNPMPNQDKIEEFITKLQGNTYHKDYTVDDYIRERLPILLEQERKEALEEAAKICDRKLSTKESAKAIRQLITKDELKAMEPRDFNEEEKKKIVKQFNKDE